MSLEPALSRLKALEGNLRAQGVSSLRLFGSQALNEGGPASDIDVMFDMDFSLFPIDRDEQALSSFRLSIVGENANKLSAELRSRHPQIPWADMVAFRNIVSHELILQGE